MSQKLNAAIAVIGIDIGKNSFHIVGHDHRGAIVLQPACRTPLSVVPHCSVLNGCMGVYICTAGPKSVKLPMCTWHTSNTTQLKLKKTRSPSFDVRAVIAKERRLRPHGVAALAEQLLQDLSPFLLSASPVAFSA
jgi:hypothetical protein